MCAASSLETFSAPPTLRATVHEAVLQTLRQAASALNDLVLTSDVLAVIRIERPRHPEHGDFAVNVSPLARWTKMAPPQIAEVFVAHWQSPLVTAESTAGFINFRLSDAVLCQGLADLVKSQKPGRNQSMSQERILLEFVSANPTGPLHIGHGRWAALGDAIRRVMIHSGASVTSEFYINDAGVQIENLTQSFWRRCLEKIDATRYPFPQKVGEEPYPYYPGEYMIDLADAYLADASHLEQIKAAAQAGDTLGEPLKSALTNYAKDTMLAQQKDLLARIEVPFEVWYSEGDLHACGQVKDTLALLEKSGYTYTQDGALWFKTSELGDEKDRVLVKSDGSYTYLTADIAYHVDKFTRKSPNGQPYNRIINIWGADHHGYIARMRASIQAMGFEVNQFEVLLGQLVNLIVEGEKTRMGKRRSMLTLEDVVDEVGVDATRFWMVSKSADTALDFDVQLAQSKTDENPVFYAQYAHARCASILRNATQPPVSVKEGASPVAFISPETLSALKQTVDAERLLPLLTSLKDGPRSEQTVKQLILRLNGFEELVADAARLRAPHLIARYCLDLASDFHSFYNACRVLTPDVDLTIARLGLVYGVQKVLATGLYLLGVKAPEQM